MKPTIVENHNVKNLIIKTVAEAKDNSIPLIMNNPKRLPSVTPIPAGKNDKTPEITDAKNNCDDIKNV